MMTGFSIGVTWFLHCARNSILRQNTTWISLRNNSLVDPKRNEPSMAKVVLFGGMCTGYIFECLDSSRPCVFSKIRAKLT